MFLKFNQELFELAFLTSVETDREHAYVIILLYGF